MDLVRAKVLRNTVVMPETHAIELENPMLGRSAQAGQFLYVRCGPTWEPLLRRPFSVHGVRPEGVSLLVQALGQGTRMIAGRRTGDLLDVLGPLGRPFSVASVTRRFLLVGGGHSLAPILALAEQVLPRGGEVVMLFGAATAERVFPASLVPPEVEYQVATEDGSLGHHGPVTELLPRYLDWADAVYACGPPPLLEAIARASRRAVSGGPGSDKPVQVAVEQQLGCAMGVCLGCVVWTRHGYQRVCRDGPVFDAGELEWGRIA